MKIEWINRGQKIEDTQDFLKLDGINRGGINRGHPGFPGRKTKIEDTQDFLKLD